MSLSIDIRRADTVSIVDVTGRITLGEGASLLRDAIKDTAKSGQKNIILNMSGVSYLDSSGLGVLVSSFATVSDTGGELKLLNLTSRVKDLLVITKLYTVFEVYEDETAAVASFVEPAVQAATSSRV